LSDLMSSVLRLNQGVAPGGAGGAGGAPSPPSPPAGAGRAPAPPPAGAGGAGGGAPAPAGAAEEEKIEEIEHQDISFGAASNSSNEVDAGDEEEKKEEEDEEKEEEVPVDHVFFVPRNSSSSSSIGHAFVSSATIVTNHDGGFGNEGDNDGGEDNSSTTDGLSEGLHVLNEVGGDHEDDSGSTVLLDTEDGVSSTATDQSAELL
jgi:hypothetical protein